ncbi:MAG: bifunctional phosphopantothenoylcysteine decarboxylase/phosphopantothenate--cysteine ligase CoaBC [Candidatus Methanomethylophilaceae archaeon]|jgi:phosphopantothenoylcysteine decarboxylase/phosphopantothenate--cysteine ligase|nr:bifunctional phosphopantothenoylcysteine decarboxylase/phosphopantothenate--cysteine ligase CoaBC [Candidatus Methanomethylophilaceae archaeon]NCA73610.1 bifunctional phosphopantothenoylcysteine decarboxylase/phosphopantothenate--cysteine ligase CoaBC [Gammaproteobacteria bacterium]
MHPSEEIYCEKSNRLKGKTVVLGITGSIAATECFSTIRELIRHGATVIPVMTRAACDIVTEQSIEFASGKKPITELTGQTEHVKLMGDSRTADLLMIYPATANTISKIANGIDDTTVTSMATVAIGNGIPVAVAPAMHEAMMKNPAVEANVEKLKQMGVKFIGPHSDGIRAKIASREEVVAWAFKLLCGNDLDGRRILIVGGRSEEPIDSMRIITNRSTGTMSISLAKRAFERGADVELWMGGCNVEIPSYVKSRRFQTVADLVGMVEMLDHEIVIVPAALSDFAPTKAFKGKIPSDEKFEADFAPVPKVLPLIRRKCDKVIGFKAESGLTDEQLVKRARARLEEYGLSAVVANDIDAAGMSSSSAVLVTKFKAADISGTKIAISDFILDFCSESL